MRHLVLLLLLVPLTTEAAVEPITVGVGQYCSKWENGYTRNGDFQIYISGYNGFLVHVVSWTTYWQKWGSGMNYLFYQVGNLCRNDNLISGYDARICPWDRGTYCYTIQPQDLYCPNPTSGRTCFDPTNQVENHGRCLPGCSAVGSCTGLIANAHFTGNATVITDPTTCPWECDTGFYLFQGVCMPIANTIIQGKCSLEASCYAMLQTPTETFQCSGNMFMFNSMQYTQGACKSSEPYTEYEIYGPGVYTPHTTYGSGVLKVSNSDAVSSVVNVSIRDNGYIKTVETFQVGTNPKTIYMGTVVHLQNLYFSLFSVPGYSYNVDAYITFNKTFEIPGNTFYIAFEGFFEDPYKDPLQFFNVAYSWKYQCTYCPANQYCVNCNSTYQGTCVPCPYNGTSSAGSVGVAKCTPNCQKGYYQGPGTACLPCQTCPNGSYVNGCSGSNTGACTNCSNTG